MKNKVILSKSMELTDYLILGDFPDFLTSIAYKNLLCFESYSSKL
jgi:hypothetical protein